jgi:hypothetical protein
MAKLCRVVGIDPGVTGAVVVISASGELERALRTPILIQKGKKVYDLQLMREVLRAAHKRSEKEGGATVVGLEKVHTLPRDGRVGAFRFGMGYGMWQGLLSGLFLPYTEVTPQRWQGKMLAGYPRGEQTKTSAVTVAKSQFPNIPIEHKADWGMADAALIGEYTRRQHLGENI